MSDADNTPPKKRRNNLILLAVIGFIGLVMETVGVGLVFTWFQQTPRSITDPRLFVGGIMALIGFVIIIRGLSWIIKQIILMTIAEN